MPRRLAKIFEEFRDNWNKIYEELEKLRTRIINAGKEPTYGLHRKKQMPFFRMFKREIFGEGTTAAAPDLSYSQRRRCLMIRRRGPDQPSG